MNDPIEVFASNADLIAVLPIVILSTWACVLLVVDLFIDDTRKAITGWLAFLGVIVALVTVLIQGYQSGNTAFNGLVAVDGLSYAFNLIFLITAAVGIMLGIGAFPRLGITRGEYYTLLLFSLIGMMVMAIANDMIVVFVALELLSIPLYILVGILRPRLDSEESAMKYFLLGAFASGFLVYGIALTYGAATTTSLPGIIENLTLQTTNAPLSALLLAGIVLLLVGLGFKVAAVPFHMWTPDVYQGAPTVVTAYMSVGAKAGGFAALLRVLFVAFPIAAAKWIPAIAILAALTMIVGNTAAIVQSNIKRMLAYSAIAHAGYILMAVASGGISDLSDTAAAAAALYLATYALTNLGAWAVVAAVERNPGEGNALADFSGLGQRRPMIALAMTIFMLSLTGIPPSVGFIGKFYVFSVTIEAGYMWLAVIGVLTSVVSAYYYLRVIIYMWMQPAPEAAPLHTPGTIRLTIALSGLATLIFGLLPASLVNLTYNALQGTF